MHLHKIKDGVSKSIITRSDKAMKERLTRNYIPVECSAIENYVADLRSGLNEQLEKDRVLLPTSSPRSTTSHELSVLCHQIEENIINGNVDTNRIKLSHRPNGERGRRQPWIAPHQQLNAEFQSL
jgi:hypothetical protein